MSYCYPGKRSCNHCEYFSEHFTLVQGSDQKAKLNAMNYYKRNMEYKRKHHHARVYVTLE